MIRRLLVVLAVAVACQRPPTSPKTAALERPVDVAPERTAMDAAVAPDAGPSPRPYRTEASGYGVDPKLSGTGKTFMVASEDLYASKVGRDVLASGGNAVDAAVATAFALAVTLPRAGNVGGGGFAVVRTGGGKVSALDFRETAPAAATSDMYAGDPKASLVGAKAAGVPGSVAGLWALHQKWGKKKWKDLVAPAIKLAREGYQVGPYLHDAIVRMHEAHRLSPELADRFAPGGESCAVGAIVKNPELAAVLELIAKKGPEGFYKGDTAKAIADAMKAAGGLITEKDLAGYKVMWRTPVTVTYRGKKFWAMPPPSSGGVMLAMTANMLRGIDLAKIGWHSTEHVHRLAEVWRRAFAVRNEVLGDPAFVKNMPIAKLTSQAEADRLSKSIGEKAKPSKEVPALLEGTNTTNFCVVDSKGMAVALTTTLNTPFGSGFVVKGIILNNEMDDFATTPGEPNVFGLVQGAANRIEPGKRMLSSMSPTIAEDEKGDLYMVVGAQGGPRIITSVWQAISNVVDFALAPDAAIAAPRVHHQQWPDDVVFENEAITREVDEALGELGYQRTWSMPQRISAGVNLIVKTPAGWAGAADPRGGGSAVGD